MVVEILFFGTGGGRGMIQSLIRIPAGFAIKIGERWMYVDPGYGVIFQAKKLNFDLKKIDFIFVSHNHIDHCNDLNILIDVLTDGCLKKKGILICSKSIIEGTEEDSPALRNYHKKGLERIYILEPYKEIDFGIFKIKGTPTKHTDPTGTSFILEYGNIKIGYTSDTAFFEELCEIFKNVNVLIINLTMGKRYHEYHMVPEDCLKLIENTTCSMYILTHFGRSMHFSNPNKFAEETSKKLGKKVVAAYDGMRIKI